jgi:hyperosmotically inducible periplasmic protein
MKFGRGVRSAGVGLTITLALCGAACDRVQQSAGPAQQTGSVGAGIDDSILSAKLAAALLADLSSRSYGFRLEVHQGAVRLSGHAPSQADIDRAVQVLRRVEGVKAVDNRAEVKPVDDSVGARVDDGIITARVKTALIADASVRGAGIGVATRKGEVQLSGFVDAPAQGERAAEIARGVEGVRAVDNQIQVKK